MAAPPSTGKRRARSTSRGAPTPATLRSRRPVTPIRTTDDEATVEMKRKATSSKTSHSATGTEFSGVTLDGKRRFRVPETPTTLEALAHWTSLPSMVSIAFFGLTAYAALPQHRIEYVIALAVFWRAAYDIGLGLLLHLQSKTAFMTKAVAAIQKYPESSLVRRGCSYLIDSTMGSGHNCFKDDDIPPEYSAWIIARFIINVVLPNDVVAFCFAAARLTDFPALLKELKAESDLSTCDWQDQICLSVWVCFPLGLLLGWMSLAGKVSAHHVIGQFAWFWGDFFFRIDQQLTFDGIFELVPHPMYTLGYGWVYSVALFSRSYAVLALALGSHLLQMFFLEVVENPHIEKLYGSESNVPPPTPSHVPIPKKGSNVFLIKNFDPYRASDVSVLLALVLLVIMCVVGAWDPVTSPLASNEFFIGHAVFWRTLTSLVLAYVLVRQERDKFWTRHWTETLESTELEAFESWKRLMNLLLSLQHVSFLICAGWLFRMPTVESMYTAFFAAKMLTASMLFLLSQWSFISTFQKLGDYGWFYGDFFLPPQEHEAKLTYTGIYRYLNNPDTYLGHFWMYAVAIVCSSWELFGVGFAAQAAHVLFLQLCEKPHIRSVYRNQVRPHSTAVEGALKRKVKEVVIRTKRAVEQSSMRHLPLVQQILPDVNGDA